MNYIPLEEHRVGELVNLWNSEIGANFPMREELFKQNSTNDVHVLKSGTFLAIDVNNGLVGFVISKCLHENTELKIGPDIGWIQVLLVKTDFRNKGIGSALLEKAEASLRKENCKKILLGRDPGHYFPGVPIEDTYTKDWFERKGYHASGVESDLLSTFSQAESISSTKIGDVAISHVQEDDKDDFLSFLNRCFPGRWEYEAIQYFNYGGTGREFIIFRKKNQIIGFCRINDKKSPLIGPNVYWAPLFEEEIGGIGPLGIDQLERKKGYGVAIVKAGIACLRARQINTIVIDWTGLVDFYRKLNFTVWKQYQQYSKNL